jgi:hypothetical protein
MEILTDVFISIWNIMGLCVYYLMWIWLAVGGVVTIWAATIMARTWIKQITGRQQ